MKRIRLKNYDWNRSVAISYVIAKQSRIRNVFGIVSFCQEESVSDDKNRKWAFFVHIFMV